MVFTSLNYCNFFRLDLLVFHVLETVRYLTVSNRLNPGQGKTGNMISQPGNQRRGKWLFHKVLQIAAPDGQQGSTLVDDADLAKQHRFIDGG